VRKEEVVMAIDKRIFERLDGIVNVRYSVKGRDEEKLESVPRNIGGGGIAVCLAEKLQPGALIDLEITIPDNPAKTISGQGQVLWTKPFGLLQPSQEVNLYETGIKFVDIDPISIGRVYSYYRQQNRI
jgi:c-di-GMP-binding flagellar brake protein YcgR